MIADTPIDRIPVFVKAGSMIPMEQRLTYADECVDTPFEIHIYPGADASFDLYEGRGRRIWLRKRRIQQYFP